MGRDLQWLGLQSWAAWVAIQALLATYQLGMLGK